MASDTFNYDKYQLSDYTIVLLTVRGEYISLKEAGLLFIYFLYCCQLEIWAGCLYHHCPYWCLPFLWNVLHVCKTSQTLRFSEVCTTNQERSLRVLRSLFFYWKIFIRNTENAPELIRNIFHKTKCHSRTDFFLLFCVAGSLSLTWNWNNVCQVGIPMSKKKHKSQKV